MEDDDTLRLAELIYKLENGAIKPSEFVQVLHGSQNGVNRFASLLPVLVQANRFLFNPNLRNVLLLLEDPCIYRHFKPYPTSLSFADMLVALPESHIECGFSQEILDMKHNISCVAEEQKLNHGTVCSILQIALQRNTSIAEGSLQHHRNTISRSPEEKADFEDWYQGFAKCDTGSLKEIINDFKELERNEDALLQDAFGNAGPVNFLLANTVQRLTRENPVDSHRYGNLFLFLLVEAAMEKIDKGDSVDWYTTAIALAVLHRWQLHSDSIPHISAWWSSLAVLLKQIPHNVDDGVVMTLIPLANIKSLPSLPLLLEILSNLPSKLPSSSFAALRLLELLSIEEIVPSEYVRILGNCLHHSVQGFSIITNQVTGIRKSHLSNGGAHVS